MTDTQDRTEKHEYCLKRLGERTYYCPRCADHFSSKGDICPSCGMTGELA